MSDLRQRLNAKKKATEDTLDIKKNDEDELDFEAEDGECNEEPFEPKSATDAQVGLDSGLFVCEMSHPLPLFSFRPTKPTRTTNPTTTTRMNWKKAKSSRRAK